MQKLLVTALGVISAIAISPFGWARISSHPWDSKNSAPRQIYLQGDSLSQGVRPALQGQLPGWKLQIDARSGRHMTEGIGRMRSARLSGIVVYALGTNDYAMPAAWQRFQLKQVVQIIGPQRCLVVPSVWAAGKSRPVFNSQIGWLKRRYPRQHIQKAYWAEAIAAGKVQLVDGTHPRRWLERAKVLADAVRRCR